MVNASDPLRQFEHDHGHLNELFLELSELLRRFDASAGTEGEAGAEETHAELLAHLEALRDDLFTHFAREEEGLFPFVAAHFPELGEDVGRIASAHDGVCGALSRLLELAGRGPAALRDQRPAATALLGRLEAGYATHGREEGVLLRRLEERVTDAERRALAGLLAGL